MAPAQERRAASRIDVEQYTIEAEISPNTQTLAAKATVRFTPLDDGLDHGVVRVEQRAERLARGGWRGQADQRLAQPAGYSRPAQLRSAADQRPAGHRHLLLRRPSHGQEDSPVYGIKFAAIHPDLRLPDVPRALVPGERLHHRPLRRRHEDHRAHGLLGGRQRNRFASRRPATRTSSSSSSIAPSFPGSIAVVKDQPGQGARPRASPPRSISAAPRPRWRSSTARRSARSCRTSPACSACRLTPI